MSDIGILIEDLERLQQRLSEAAHHGLQTMAVERSNTELLARAAAALRSQRVEVIAECADVLDRKFEIVMAMQAPDPEPLSEAYMTNMHLRMSAALLPGIAKDLRQMGGIRTI